MNYKQLKLRLYKQLEWKIPWWFRKWFKTNDCLPEDILEMPRQEGKNEMCFMQN